MDSPPRRMAEDVFDMGQPQTAPLPGRGAIRAAQGRSEADALAAQLEAIPLEVAESARVQALARRLVLQLRQRRSGRFGLGGVEQMLQAFPLNSSEGLALMGLAEALLRIPDSATRDALIRDKLFGRRWSVAGGGAASSWFAHAAGRGLSLVSRLFTASGGFDLLLRQGTAPLLRQAVEAAMRRMGQQFICGESIGQALANSRPAQAQGFRHSFDMLGEAASSAQDAERYQSLYRGAIDAVARANAGRRLDEGDGVSIKLSALHPRYGRTQRGRVMSELWPALRALALQARAAQVGLNLDAEEADRLELSLDLLEALCAEPELAGWNGLGFVVQAYQKRAPQVIAHLVDLARRGAANSA